MNARLTIGIAALAIPLTGTACNLRPAEERTLGDLEVGSASTTAFDFAVIDGHAHVHSVNDDQLYLWAQSPTIEFRVIANADRQTTEHSIAITIDNCMPASLLTATGGDTGWTATPLPAQSPTRCAWQLTLPSGTTTLRLAPADADQVETWRFAVLSDIQEAIPTVDDIFRSIAVDPSLRFVVSTGDLVDRAHRDEYEAFVAQLDHLPIPFISTIGNHELYGDSSLWRDYFGRVNLHFAFKGTVFTLVDSANATIDPLVYEWVEEWLADAQDSLHIFLTHIPPLDPIGVRSGSFRSRAEAAKLLRLLAAGGVDLTIYGHIHSYYHYENAGIPAHLSGGGGAWPELGDGIDRHYLVVEVGSAGVESVTVVEVD